MTLSSLQGKEQGVVNPIASPYDGGDIPDDELEGIEKNMFDDWWLTHHMTNRLITYTNVYIIYVYIFELVFGI